jgi:maltose alpha-D-glucosyltransferase / alpha-amylase
MMQHGDEIGMGDDLRLSERECARTPMRWTAGPHAGFSRARKAVCPVIRDATFGFERVNVALQRRDPESMLNWTERMVRTRKECPEISWGNFVVLRTNVPEVLAIRYDWRDTSLVTLHNFSPATQKTRVKIGTPRDGLLVDVFDGHHAKTYADGAHRFNLPPYARRWYRVGGADNVLDRSDLDLTNPMR